MLSILSLRKWLIPVKPDELSGILYYNVCRKISGGGGGGDVARALVPLGPPYLHPCKRTVVLMILISILEFTSHKSGHILVE